MLGRGTQPSMETLNILFILMCGFMRIDFEELFRDRLIQVKKDIRKANNIGDWEIKRELMREKKDLVNKLKKYELKEK